MTLPARVPRQGISFPQSMKIFEFHETAEERQAKKKELLASNKNTKQKGREHVPYASLVSDEFC